jgi:membrane protease subunit (stomatin/prohibitin family)
MSSHASVALVVLLLWTTVAVAVGIHASSRGRSGFVWGFVAFLMGLVGVVVYLLALLITDDPPTDQDDRDDDTRQRRVCPECSTGHEGSPNYCSECGEPLDADDNVVVARVLRSGSRGYCSNCKSRVGLDADACADCGAVF